MSGSGDPWITALGAYSCGDIEPLKKYLVTNADGGGTLSGQQQRDLAALLDSLQARSLKRRRGKPGGTLWRWTDANYLAARFVEMRIAARKHETGGHNLSAEQRSEIIVYTVAEAKDWHCAKAKRKPPSVDRVTAILNGPRSRRLPG